MAVDKSCENCLYVGEPHDYGPCRSCGNFERWYPAPPWQDKQDKRDDQPQIEGVHPDMPVVTNEQGGKQSDSPYCWTDLDPTAMLEIAKRSGGGRKKYGEGNWLKIDWKEHLNHALTHIYAWLAGDTQDNHPAAAAWRVIAALGVYLKTKGE